MSFWKTLIKKNRNDIDEIDAILNEYGSIDYYNTIYTYDVNDNLTTIVWKNEANVTLRTDTFTYLSSTENETIVQTIVIVGGATIVISTLFDLMGNVLSVDRSIV